MAEVMLSPLLVIFGTLLHPLMFVGALYVFPDPLLQKLPRDHASVIRHRLTRITLASLASVLLTGYLYTYTLTTSISLWAFLAQWCTAIGITYKNALGAAVLGLLWTALLFLGPIYVEWLDLHLHYQGLVTLGRDIKHTFNSLLGWRNIVLAPLFEELVFRGCIIPLWRWGGYTTPVLVFVTPIFFGLSHLHHWIARCRFTHQWTIAYLGPSLFQMAYTTLFGWLAAYLFLLTGNLLAPVLSHALCNTMGFPDFEKVSQFPSYRPAIYTLYGVGILGFVGALWASLTPFHQLINSQ